MSIAEWTGTDWAANITALSVLLGSVGALFEKMRRVEKKVDETKEVANGTLTRAQARIEQLSRVITDNGLSLPPSPKEVRKEDS